MDMQNQFLNIHNSFFWISLRQIMAIKYLGLLWKSLQILYIHNSVLGL